MPSSKKRERTCTAYVVGNFHEDRVRKFVFALMDRRERQEKERGNVDWRKLPRKRKLTPPRD